MSTEKEKTMTAITIPRSPAASTRTLTTLLATDNSVGLLILRVVLGVVLVPHGLQKTVGWFGGYGFDGTMGWFASLGIPALFGFLAIATETAGALALIAGLGTRIAALGVAGVMSVAGVMVHRKFFLMNWSGTQGGEGFEYHLLGAAIAVALVIGGAGRWSLDRAIAKTVSNG
jgi:putative oxidoreductase